MGNVLRCRRGANLIMVIMLMLLLAIVGTSLVMVSTFSVRSTVTQREHDQGYYLARGITTTLVDAIKAGNCSAMNALLDMAKTDYEAYEADHAAYINNPQGPEPQPTDTVKAAYTTAGTTENIDGEGSRAVTELSFDYFTQTATVSVTVTYQEEDYALGASLQMSGSSVTPGDPGGGGESEYALGTGSTLTLATSTGNLEILSADGKKNALDVIEGNLTVGASNSNDPGSVRSDLALLPRSGTQETGNLTIGRYGTVTGTVWAAGNVDIAGAIKADPGNTTPDAKSGSIYSQKAVTITTSNDWGKVTAIPGEIVAVGDVSFLQRGSLNWVEIGHGVHTDGSVQIHEPTVFGGDIIAGKDVTVNVGLGGYFKENHFRGVQAGGKVNLTQSRVDGDIYAVGDVTLSGCTVSGNIYSNGNVRLSNRCSVTGTITAAGSISGSGGSSQHQHSAETEITIEPVQVVIPGGKVIRTAYNAPADALPLHSRDLNATFTIDNSMGDVYYKWSDNGSGTLDVSKLSFTGSHRVFIFFDGKTTLSGAGGNSDLLFLIGSNGATLTLSETCNAKAQIYMPDGTIELKNGNYVKSIVTGIVTVGKLDLHNKSVLEVRYAPANYSGTGIPIGSGGTATGGTVDFGQWSEVSYYDL